MILEPEVLTVEWIDDVLPKSYEAELVEDMVSLMASFSAKVYGKRSTTTSTRKLHVRSSTPPTPARRAHHAATSPG